MQFLLDFVAPYKLTHIFLLDLQFFLRLFLSTVNKSHILDILHYIYIHTHIKVIKHLCVISYKTLMCYKL